MKSNPQNLPKKTFLKLALIIFGGLTLVACSKDKTPSPDATSAPASQVGGVEQPSAQRPVVTCKTEMPVSSDYDSTKDAVKNESRWLRDAGSNLVITTIANIRLDGSAYDQGSGAETAFADGHFINYDKYDQKYSQEQTTICFLAVAYGNEDFDEMLENKLAKKEFPYPAMFLPPGTLRGTLHSVSESTATSPSNKLPGGICPNEPVITKSYYEFIVKPAVGLLNAKGKKSGSTLSAIRCVGYNQKGASIVKALGANKVGAVEL